MAEYPGDLRYTTEHEWVRAGEDSVARVGITDFAATSLGDIVFVSLPAVGSEVTKGNPCGELESTKSVSEVFAPVTGTVSAVNDTLTNAPETVNADPYEEGWLFEVTMTAPEELETLLDATGYAQLTGA
jgi:glycine cleavage system H protein